MNDLFFQSSDEMHDTRTPRRGYVCRICNEPGHYIQHCPQKTNTGSGSSKKRSYDNALSEGKYRSDHAGERAKNKRPVFTRSMDSKSCWFCLTNPDFEKHLVVYVGSNVYLALPKGSLVDDHLLVVPISHISSFTELKERDHNAFNAIKEEISQLKAKFRKILHASNKLLVSYEVHPGQKNAGSGSLPQHMHIQLIGVKEEVSSKVAESFRELSASKQLRTVSSELKDEDLNLGYAKVEIHKSRVSPEDSNSTEAITIVPNRDDSGDIGAPVPVFLGRLAVATALGCAWRSNWRRCVLPKDKEQDLCASFSRKFSENS